MDVFISWSGEKSKTVALAIRDWLPNLFPQITPFVSSEDIERGSRWVSELSAKLTTTKVGIVCLTTSNLKSEWIHFEAGALSSKVERTFVCTLAVGFEPELLVEPLSQFQASKADKDGFRRLVVTMNRAPESPMIAEHRLQNSFDVWWPYLEKKLQELPDETTAIPEFNLPAILDEIRGGVNSLRDDQRLLRQGVRIFNGGRRFNKAVWDATPKLRSAEMLEQIVEDYLPADHLGKIAFKGIEAKPDGFVLFLQSGSSRVVTKRIELGTQALDIEISVAEFLASALK